MATSRRGEDVHTLGASHDALGSMPDTTGQVTQPFSTAPQHPETVLSLNEG